MNEKKRHGRPRSRFTAKEILGYLAIITVLGGLLMVILKLLAPPAEAGVYNFYESPILPLSSLSGAENVEAERLVTLDFGVYEEEEFRSQEEVLVTDAYILTNPHGNGRNRGTELGVRHIVSGVGYRSDTCHHRKWCAGAGADLP